MTTKTTNQIRAASMRVGAAVASALMLVAAGCGGEGAGVDDPAVTPPAGGGEETAAFTPPTFDAETETAMHLRAEIAVPNQGFVKFFEPEDGVLLIQEAGRNNMPALVPNSMNKLTATEMYEALSGQKAPDALVQATARAAKLAARTARTDVAKVADLSPDVLRDAARGLKTDSESETITSALTFANGYDQWFYDSFCAGGKSVDGGNTGTWDFIVNWMFVTGSGSFTRNDYNFVDSTVSVYGGGAVHYKVRIQPWYSWSTVADVQIENGYYNKYHRSAGTDYDINAAVDQAAGDSYHWCAYGDSW